MMQHVSPAPAVTMMATQSVPPPSYQESQQMTGTTQQNTKTPQVHIPAASAAGNTSVSVTLDPQAQLESDKRAVYRHPLFPLLALLFEKCEQATQGSECITSASFDVDIENFVHQQEREHKPFFSEDPELDNLMVKAIQVLRIHLLELEKVNELCKDFCNRYITCLKTKMHSDNLLRNDLGGPYSPSHTSLNMQQELIQTSSPSMTSVSSSVNPSGIVVPAGGLQQGNVAMTTINSQVVSGGTLYQPVAMVTSQGQVLTQALPPGTIQIQNSQVNVDLSSLLDSEDKKSKNKRGVLPKHATNIMRSWLFQHLMHPYPTEDEKRQIAAQTNLTLLQVNNWFINARRRILQPMLDASNPDPAPKAKKMKSQHRPTQRFWPDSIVAGVLQTHRSGNNSDNPLSMDSLQSLSSDSATLAMQQAMLGADDSMDGTEEEDEEEEEEEEEEGMEEEEEEEDGEEENDRGRQMSSGGGGRRDLRMEHREELEFSYGVNSTAKVWMQLHPQQPRLPPHPPPMDQPDSQLKKEEFKMSIAQAAAKAMLSDALLQGSPGINRISHLELELPLDKVIKFVSVGLPLMLVCMAFAREISLGPQISCFPPSNFTVKQASYVDTYCWDSLMHHEFDSDGNFEERSLWVHKMFPYSLLAMAVLMYLPALIWRQLVMPSLGSDLLFIIDELDKSYNRSIRLAQNILDMRQNTKNPLTFQAELQRAKKKRYFEYPLLERYMQCKQNSYFLVSMLFLRGFLLLTFMTAACLYLAYFHLSAFMQDEFSCFVRTGMLRDHNWVPELIQCKMIGQLVFQVISVANGAIYVLLAPIVLFSLIRLFVWDTSFFSVYEVLPALDIINRRRLGCPLNDLNVLLLFLRANVAHLMSYGKVRALCSLAPPQVGSATATQGLDAMLTQEEMEEREEAAMELAEEVEEAKEEGKLNLVDIMTILGAAQGRVVNCSEKRPLVEENMSLEPNHQGYHELKETGPFSHY
ncbi:homeobox protein PKNOX2 [Plectropomus leopardus]|uniref:homeobox protein PKNOX2 n=1 Tax=Plectropomus leopardus TaxID=160734 RepID=UPI001C4BBE34|nr:homeobox protein PKNOX2 [Plectropomus leopardus]